jgi:hypothetical protein
VRAVAISKELRIYLRSATYLPTTLREIILTNLATDDQTTVTLSLDPETAENFGECFTQRLAQVGFDSSYQVSGEGATLEELIDRFAG